MKRGNCSTAAVVFAALTIIGCCAYSMFSSRRRRITQREEIEVAQQDWEAEGGAVLPEREEQLA